MASLKILATSCSYEDFGILMATILRLPTKYNLMRRNGIGGHQQLRRVFCLDCQETTEHFFVDIYQFSASIPYTSN